MPRLDALASPFMDAGQWCKRNVPVTVQVIGVFLLTPLWAASWLQAIINIPVVGIFLPFFLAGELTGSIRASVAAGLLWHALIYAFISFSAGFVGGARTSVWWTALVWPALLVGAGLGWLIWPLFSTAGG